MKVFVVCLCIVVLLLLVLYLFSLRGRRYNYQKKSFLHIRYTHRGLFKRGFIPENSLSAFKNAVIKGFGIELDVHLLSDGSLAVIHDHSLERTTGQKGTVEELTAADLSKYKLENSNQTIPLFKQVLSVVNGAVPLVVELKAKNNVNRLCEAVVAELENYNGKWCIESFDPRCIYWFKKHKPEVVRGQLVMNYVKGGGKGKGILKYLLSWQFFNFLTKPDFISVKLKDRKDLSTRICKNFWKMDCFVWTVTDENTLEICEKEGFTPIFEQFEPKNNRSEVK